MKQEKFQFTNLFQENLKEQFQNSLKNDLHLYAQLIAKEEDLDKKEMKTYATKLESHEIKIENFSSNFFDQVLQGRFYQSENLMIFLLKDKLVFYSILQKQYKEHLFGQERIYSFDFCPQSQTLIFGHQKGRVSFANLSNLQVIGNSKKNYSFKDTVEIKMIRFIYFDQIFVYIDQNNKSELVYFVNMSNSIQSYGLLKTNKIFSQIEYVIVEEDEFNCMGYLGMCSTEDVYLISFQFQRIETGVGKLYQLEIKNKFISPQENKETKIMFRKIDKKRFDLILQWSDCLEWINFRQKEQEEFGKQLIEISKHKIDEKILCAFFEGEKLILNLKKTYSIQNNRLIEQQLQISQRIKKHFFIFENKEGLFQSDGGDLELICRSVSTSILNEFLGKNQINDFLDYSIQMEKQETQSIIEKILKQRDCHLLNQFLLENQNKILKFFSEKIDEKNLLIVDFCFKFKLYDFYVYQLMPLILQNQRMKENLLQIFLQRNLQNFSSEIISINHNEIFFINLFNFAAKHKFIFQKFLFQFYQLHQISQSLLGILQSLSISYQLDYFTFYLYFSNPLNLELLNILFPDKIELIPKQFIDRLFVFIYDLYTLQSLEQMLLFSEQQIYEFKIFIKNFFLSKINIFLEMRFKETIILLYKMNDKCSQFSDSDDLFFNFDVYLNRVFNKFLIDQNYKGILCSVCFTFKINKIQINKKFLLKYSLSLLDVKSLELCKKNFNFKYFFEFAFQIYLIYRKDLIETQQFKNFLLENSHKDEIYSILLGLYQNNLETQFDVYLKNDWYFQILKANLKIFEDHSAYVKLIKKYIDKIVFKNEKKFLQIFILLKSKDQLEITSLLKNNAIQQQLFDIILQKNHDVLSNEEVGQNLDLLCIYKPQLVVKLLQTQKYDQKMVFEILQKHNHQKGLIYMNFTQGQNQQGLMMVKDYIKQHFNEEKEVQDIVECMLSCNSVKDDYLITLMEFLRFSASLSKMNKKIKQKIYQKIFQTKHDDTYSFFKNENFLDFILQSSEQTTLFFSHINQQHYQKEIQQKIYNKRDVKKKNLLIYYSQKGISIVKNPCAFCCQIQGTKDSFIYFHRCKQMYHPQCLKKYPQYVNHCIVCQANEFYERESNLIVKNFTRKRTQSFAEKIEHKSQNFLKQKLDYFQTFEKGELIQMQNLCEKFEDLKIEQEIGLNSIKYIHNYFDL